MNLRQRWKQTTIANKLMVWTTVVVAFGAVFQAGMAFFQYRLMKESGKQTSEQTDKLIAATQRMADTTGDTLKEAKRSNEESANRADRAIQASEKFADAAKRQADASAQSAESGKASARAAEQSASIARQSMTISSRPYIGVEVHIVSMLADQIIELEMKLLNEGNSTAVVKGRTTFILSKTQTIGINSEQEWTSFGPSEVLPRKDRTLVVVSKGRLTAEQMEAIRQRKLFLFFYGEGSYDSLNHTYPLEFAACYIPERNFFADCQVNEPKKERARQK
jgi:hypothetical protein